MAEQSEFAKRCAWLMSTKRIALEPMDALVLFALHLHADEENRCWPKASVLCFETGMNEVTFYRKVKRLERLKLVTRGRLKRTGGRYFCLHLDCPTDSLDCPTDSDCRRDSDCPTDSVDCPTDSVDCPTDSPIELNKDIKGTVQELSKAAAWEDVGYDYQEDVCVRYDEDQNVTRQPVTSLTKSSVAATTPKPPPSVACEIGDSAQLKSIGGQRYRASGSRSKRLDTKDLDAKVDKLISVYPSPSTNRSLAVKHLQTALTGKPFDQILAAATAHGAARDPQYLTGLHNWLSGSMFDNPVAARKKGLGDPIHMTVDFGRNLRNAS